MLFTLENVLICFVLRACALFTQACSFVVEKVYKPILPNRVCRLPRLCIVSKGKKISQLKLKGMCMSS